MQVICMAAILMIIAPKGFRDEELLVPKEVFEAAGHEVKIASISRTAATGMLGTKITPDFAAHEVNLDFFDCVIVVGGSGSPMLAQSADVITVVRKGFWEGKLIAGICLGPIVLARAGVLVGKQATIFRTSDAVTLLQSSGAAYKAESVVVDGNVITADGPAAAETFARKIVELLTKSTTDQ